MRNEVQIMDENLPKYAPVPTSGAEAILGMIERIASNPDADMTKMQALMEMRNAELVRVARVSFSSDFSKMAPKLPLVIKNNFNGQTSSKYAKLENINQEINPILAEYGFATSTRIIAQTDKSVTVEAVLWHRDGHLESTPLTLPLDNVGLKGNANKTEVHATAASITYAKRIALCALLNISTGDDTDGNAPAAVSYITNDEAMDIEKQIAELDINRADFLKYMNVEAIDKIEFRFKAKAMTSLAAKRKKMNETENV